MNKDVSHRNSESWRISTGHFITEKKVFYIFSRMNRQAKGDLSDRSNQTNEISIG